MKVEFQNGQFSACMNESDAQQEVLAASKGNLTHAHERLGLILGIIALISAFIQIPYGFIASACAELLEDIWAPNPFRFTIAAVLGCIVLAAVTIVSAVLSLVLYAKEKGSKTAGIGRVLAIIAVVLCGVAALCNVICFIVFLL